MWAYGSFLTCMVYSYYRRAIYRQPIAHQAQVEGQMQVVQSHIAVIEKPGSFSG
jgi:hypothetical protein